MEGKRKKSNKSRRIQAGNIHVCFRGNNRNVVFYDDNDYIELLLRCNRFANRYKTKVIAFAIMHNHAHFQIKTNNLTLFMRPFLNSYSRWYNMKYCMSGQVFSSPFMSSCKYTDEWLEKSVIYILNNPIKASVCTNPRYYLWSSYHFYFGRRNPLAKYIEVDTSFVEERFKNRDALDLAIASEISFDFERHDNIVNSCEKIPYNQVIEHFIKLLNKKTWLTLSKEECKKIIAEIRRDTGASYRQIASITHESWEFVRRCCVAR